MFRHQSQSRQKEEAPESQPEKQNESQMDSAEQELERILIARDELLDGLAHDLKNALSSILLNTSLARRVVPENDQCVRQIFERIHEATERIRMSMQDALDMTGCVSGNLAVTPARRQIKILIGDALAQVEEQCVAKDIHFVVNGVNGDNEGLSVIADHEKIPRALSRLLAYGIKISPPKTEIQLRVEQIGDEIQIRMLLPAETIAPEQLSHVFERQGKKPGMYLVRGIVEIFGGRTWAMTVAQDGRKEVELGMGLKGEVHDGTVRQLVQS